MLQIYNTLHRAKEPFRPLDERASRVGLYYCGPTVYDSLHLGHGRAAVVPDVMRRYLEYRDHQVLYVSNFTDVDDHIITRAIREQRDWREITWTYMEEYTRVTSALGNRPPDAHPRATAHIGEMVELAVRLVEAGNAYVASDGDLYFDTSSFAGYGALSHRDLDQQLADASGRLLEGRLQVKRNPADFIVWKLLRNDGDEFQSHPARVPGWDSPWGKGRPGWHLECSALAHRYLGVPFDIHGGGADLIFPHHENERAQNCCAHPAVAATGGDVRYWVHNGFITVRATTQAERDSAHTAGDQVKMSKSLGNVRWLREMIWPEGPYDPLSVRMLLLSSHYRSPLEFAPDLLEQSTARLDRIYGAIERLAALPVAPEPVEPEPVEAEQPADVRGARLQFERGMDDDFNTPAALAAIFELCSFAQRELMAADESAAAPRAAALGALRSLLHTLRFPAQRSERAPAGDRGREDELLALLAEVRHEARGAKLYALSDRVRARLHELGYQVQDRAGAPALVIRRD